MAGPVPAIGVFASSEIKTWMPATRPGMTKATKPASRNEVLYKNLPVSIQVSPVSGQL
jgi:hypothetical protein